MVLLTGGALSACRCCKLCGDHSDALVDLFPHSGDECALVLTDGREHVWDSQRGGVLRLSGHESQRAAERSARGGREECWIGELEGRSWLLIV